MPHEPLRPLSQTEMEVLEEAVSQYERNLDGVAQYLAGPTRGLDKATAERFRVGQVVDPLPGHERYEGWVAIPYLGIHGEPLKLRFRCPEDHDHKEHRHGKFEDLPHATPRLFNVSSVLEADEYLAVAEGEWDCMILEQIGIPAIALPGAQSWQPHYRRILAGFDKIYLFGDPDPAGREMNLQVQKALRQSVVVKLDADITDTVIANGPGAIYDALGFEYAD